MNVLRVIKRDLEMKTLGLLALILTEILVVGSGDVFMAKCGKIWIIFGSKMMGCTVRCFVDVRSALDGSETAGIQAHGID